MNRIPALFTESVLSLLHNYTGDSADFDRRKLARLHCRTWDEQYFTRPSSCRLWIYPEANNHEISYKFTVNGELTRLEDFHEQNAIIVRVELACDDAVIARLKWILARKFCGLFCCYLNPATDEELTARLLPAMPHTFRSIDFEWSSELAENFLLETSKNQQIEQLLGETRKYGAKLDRLLNRLFLSPATSSLWIADEYDNPFTLQTFETLIARWIANPDHWKWNLHVWVPIDFDPHLLSKHVKYLKTRNEHSEDYFVRKVAIGGHLVEVFYRQATRSCKLILTRPHDVPYAAFLSRAHRAMREMNRHVDDFVF